MKKCFNEWKIYFSSMSNMRMNLSFTIIFLFISLLNQDVLFGEQRTGEINPLYWTLSVILICNAILYFIRMNFNKENFRFSKTLPSSKKIYTRNVWLSFEIINTIYLFTGLILWIIFSQKGIVSVYSPFIFFADCILHLFISAAFPFLALPASSENNKKRKSVSFDALWRHWLFLYFSSLVFCILMSYISKLAVKNEMTFFTVNPVYILICALIVIFSWTVNRLIFNKIYKLL